MAASVNYTPLTDAETLWATLADAIAFFNAMSVSSATTATEGVVKKAAALTNPMPDGTLTQDYYALTAMLANGDEVLQASLVTQSAYEDLCSKYAALITRITELETKLNAAGLLAS